MTEAAPDDAPGAAPAPPPSLRDPAGTPVATIGTGSALAIGCVGLLIALVVIALTVRSLTDIW